MDYVIEIGEQIRRLINYYNLLEAKFVYLIKIL